MRSARKCFDSSAERSAGEVSPGLPLGVLHVGAFVLVRGGERLRVPHYHDARAVRQEEALVRVENDRVGPLDPAQQLPPMLRQEEEATVRGVHVEPAALPLGDRRDGVERIHGPGVGRAGGGDHEPRPEPGRAIGRDALGQRVRPHAEAVVHRHVAHRRLAQARDAERLLDAVMGLGGQVDHRACVVGSLEAVRLARGDDRGERGDAAARGDVARRGRGVAHEIGHPAHQQVLHPHRPGAGEEDARVLVAHGRQEVAERRVVEAAARDVGEVAGRGRIAAGPDHVLLEQRDDLAERAAVLEDRDVEQAAARDALLIVGLEGVDAPEEALGRGDRGVTQAAAAAGAGIERPRGALELAKTREQRGPLGGGGVGRVGGIRHRRGVEVNRRQALRVGGVHATARAKLVFPPCRHHRPGARGLVLERLHSLESPVRLS